MMSVSGSVCGAEKVEEKIVAFDFGVISEGEVVAHRFTFDQEVTSAVSFCECVIFEIYSDESACVVEVAFNSSGYKGAVLQELLAINGEETIRIKLYAVVE